MPDFFVKEISVNVSQLWVQPQPLSVGRKKWSQLCPAVHATMRGKFKLNWLISRRVNSLDQGSILNAFQVGLRLRRRLSEKIQTRKDIVKKLRLVELILPHDAGLQHNHCKYGSTWLQASSIQREHYILCSSQPINVESVWYNCTYALVLFLRSNCCKTPTLTLLTYKSPKHTIVSIEINHFLCKLNL